MNPAWLHFGVGNLFRAFPLALMQTLIDTGVSCTGIIAASVHDHEPVERVLRPNGNRSTLVTFKSDGSTEIRELTALADSLRIDNDYTRLREIFESPELQLVSFTITEKGYTEAAVFEQIAGLLRARAAAAEHKLAFLSLDNCADNGKVLRNAVLRAAAGDIKLAEYIRSSVTFPLSMIDKITPQPDPEIAASLGAEIITTKTGGHHASFVNAEESQYLVIEDDFPNGRPKLELGGPNVFFTDRDTVRAADRMKVGACLNPLHTALAIFGVLLGYERVCDAIRDQDIYALITRLGYSETLPSSPDPGIISPRDFMRTFIEERLPNPRIPDKCARIATDTSQKITPRYGNILQYYAASPEALTAVPLVFAAWLRYLSGTRDDGQPCELSPDPLADELTCLAPAEILAREDLFSVNLHTYKLSARILEYLDEMSAGSGAVRETLRRRLRLE